MCYPKNAVVWKINTKMCSILNDIRNICTENLSDAWWGYISNSLKETSDGNKNLFSFEGSV